MPTVREFDRHLATGIRDGVVVAPSAGFEPALTAPEADALSPELRGLAGRAYSAGWFAARVAQGTPALVDRA